MDYGSGETLIVVLVCVVAFSVMMDTGSSAWTQWLSKSVQGCDHGCRASGVGKATSYPSITPEQADLIRESKVFFVASLSPDLSHGPDGQGPVNLSPKGGVPLHVINDQRVAYLDYTGSGNETRRHAESGGPITLMVMSMSGDDAAVVRLFGTARVVPIDESDLKDLLLAHPADDIELPQRQVIDIAVVGTQTSCGYGVPVYEYVGERVRGQRGRRYKEATGRRSVAARIEKTPVQPLDRGD